MTLPGRLSIAYLEEDNPQKFYFRMRPLLVREQERIELFQDAGEQYPTEGFIRVVPDKNEMCQFKSRMRMIGRYCILDLRRHPNENDKIRPNKNCIPVGGDPNAYIVYSDVVYAVAPGLITQILDIAAPEGAESFSAAVAVPETACVALRSGGKITGPWKWEPEEEGTVLFRRVPARDWDWQEADKPAGLCLSLELPGGEIRPVYVNLSVLDKREEAVPPYVPPVDDVPACFREPCEPYAAAPRAEAAAAFVNAQVKCEAEVPSREGTPAVCESVPVRECDAAKECAPARLDRQTHDCAPTIPLTTHRAINSRITMREQELLAQMGVNPRRGRSLYEIVDEKWRRSRIDQLGHPIPGEATGSPANDPIENAMTAIRAVLPIPEARTNLIEEMLRNETLNEALGEVYGAKRAAARSDDACLTEMEADRLALSAEIDALRRRREAERALIVDEVRTEYQMEFARLDKKKAQLEADIAALQSAEQNARAAASAATEALDKTLKEDVDAKLLDTVMQSRARSLILGIDGKHTGTPPRPVTVDPNACQLISDVRGYFERAGRPISNDDAVNLLGCLTVGRTVMVSGPVGSGKRDTIRLLAMAIGIALPEYHRFTITSDYQIAEKLISEGTLVCDDEAMTLCMLASANCQGNVRGAVSAIYGAQMRRSNGLRAVISIDDAPDAYPVPAALYDRAYTIRLQHAGADQPWRPAVARPVSYGKVVSLEAMKKIFDPVNDLPVEMEMRMTALRERLDKLGTPITRRSLDALWRYCSAVLPYMQCSPMELLDRALSQRGLPSLLSTMPLEALMELPDIFKGMDRCLKLLDEPLPLPALY